MLETTFEVNPMSDQPEMRGKYFEEFEIGMKIVTVSRTVTETDVVQFAGLSGDYTQIHTDAVYSQKGPFGQRVAHGLLVLSIFSGLAVQTGFIEGTVIAFREIESWKFTKPVFIGDTVHGVMEIVEKKHFRRLNAGAVILKIQLIY